MKSLALLTVTFLALTAGVAWAQPSPGVNLSWNDCTASLWTNLSMSSTCSSNSETTRNLYGTFVLPPGGISALTGNDIVLDIFPCASTLPCWWNFTLAPRNVGYEMKFDAVCPDAAGVGIFDYWSSIPGGPSGGAAAKIIAGIPQRIRILGVVAVDATQAQPAPGGVEIYSFTLQLKFDATVGSCTGCATQASIILNSIQVTGTGGQFIQLSAPSAWNQVGWQGYYINACTPDPVLNKTWGAVKALYR
jgi:hypothetical protein